MKRGDIVIIPFPFTNLTGSKIRPALVLYVGNIDIVVSFISTQMHVVDVHDVTLIPDKINNLKKVSLLKVSKMATLERALALGKIGEIDPQVSIQVQARLKIVFDLI